MTKKVLITGKGIAAMAAIESGLMPRVEGGWDDTAFNKFWDIYTARLIKLVPKARKILKLD